MRFRPWETVSLSKGGFWGRQSAAVRKQGYGFALYGPPRYGVRPLLRLFAKRQGAESWAQWVAGRMIGGAHWWKVTRWGNPDGTNRRDSF